MTVWHTARLRESFLQIKFGIKVCPGAVVLGDQKMIAEFIGKTVDDLGSFPVNSQDYIPLKSGSERKQHLEE